MKKRFIVPGLITAWLLVLGAMKGGIHITRSESPQNVREDDGGLTCSFPTISNENTKKSFMAYLAAYTSGKSSRVGDDKPNLARVVRALLAGCVSPTDRVLTAQIGGMDGNPTLLRGVSNV